MTTHQNTVDGYTYVKSLPEDGIRHQGLYVVRDVKTQELAICKKLASVHSSAKEAEIMAALTPHPHIPKLYKFVRAERRSPPDCNHHSKCEKVGCPNKYFDKIYMEYYDGGSLRDVRTTYRELGVAIPEAFIWEVLESLVKTLCFLHLGINVDPGDLKGNDAAPQHYNWTPILHKDIHTGNIFLASQTTTSVYPRIVLGDLGCASRKWHSREVDWDVWNMVETISELCEVGEGTWKTCNGVIQVSRAGQWIYSDELLGLLTLANIEGTPSDDAESVWIIWEELKRAKEKVKEKLVMEPLAKLIPQMQHDEVSGSAGSLS